jgi:hypothetical protein
MNERTDFKLELSHVKYMSTSDQVMNAILNVTASGGKVPAEAAEVLLVDCSESMGWVPTKIAAAKRATAAAIDALRDGVWFAVVEGTEDARVVYPAHPALIRAGKRTRAEAKMVTSKLFAGGRTAMSTWLSLAKRLLDAHPNAVRHAILLTDGMNEAEPAERLTEVLNECEGHFVCDARGIGDDWDPAELSRIAEVLRGTADAVVTDAELPLDFERMIQAAMRKTVQELSLRITIMPFAELRFVKQVHPAEVDLTDRCVEAGHNVLELSTGSWGQEYREYHVCLEANLAGKKMETDIQLARVSVVEFASGVRTESEPVSIFGCVTDLAELSSQLDPKVERYTVRHELGQAVRAGWDAFEADDRETAAEKWGLAVKLATELRNQTVLKTLWPLVDIEDATEGRVRVKDHIRPRDGFSAMLRSGISEFGSEPNAGRVVPDNAAGADRKCPECGRIAPPDFAVCEGCGRRFTS